MAIVEACYQSSELGAVPIFMTQGSGLKA